MVKKHLIGILRIFLYLLAVFLLSFHLFGISLNFSNINSFFINKIFAGKLSYEGISFRQSLKGIDINLENFNYDGDIKVEGQVTEYSKIADSGNERIQGFCGTCGCQLYARAPDKSLFNVRTGFLKQHHTLTPAKHIFGQSKVAWIKTIFEGKWHIAGPDSDEMKP